MKLVCNFFLILSVEDCIIVNNDLMLHFPFVKFDLEPVCGSDCQLNENVDNFEAGISINHNSLMTRYALWARFLNGTEVLIIQMEIN